MLKDRKWYAVCGFILACMIVNFGGKVLSESQELPLWLDSLGTIASAYALGPVCGAAVGLSVNVIYGLLYSETYMVYGIVSVAIGLIAGVCARRKWFDSMFGAMSTGFIITIVSVAISVPCNYVFFDGRVTNTWGNGVIVMLESIGVNRFLCHVTGEFYVDFLDKVLICAVVFMFIRFVRLITDKNGHERVIAQPGAKKTAVALIFVLVVSLICAAFIGYVAKDRDGDEYGAGSHEVDAELVNGEGSFDDDDGSLDFDRYVHTVYDGSNGLVGGTANTIAQTDDGILWIGTYGGLYRYNGTQFSLMDDFKSVKSVNCLYTDDSGRLWIGTNDNGLSICADEKITDVLDESDGLGSDSVRCIAKDSLGNYYIGTTGSLSVVTLEGGIWVKESVSDIVYATDVTADDTGNVAVVTDDGTLYIVSGGEIQSRHHGTDAKGYESCLFAEDGSLYAGTTAGDIYVYGLDGGKLELKKTISCPSLSNIQSITEVGQTLYVCADNGAGYIDIYSVYHRINTNGFSSSLENMLVDYQGNYWFTSSRLGLLRMCPSVFTDVNSEYGLDEEVVNTTEWWNNLLYVGMDNGLAAVDLSRHHRKNDDLTDALTDVRIRDLMADSRGNLWIATSGMGIYRVSADNEITIFDADKKVNGTKFRSIIELADGTIMASGDSGITYINGDEVVKIVGYDDGLENPKLLCTLELSGEDGSYVLAGSDGAGIYRIEDGEITGHYGREDGLSSNVILRITQMRDDRGLLIVTSNGICHMDSAGNIRTIDGFPYYNNYDIVEREDGMLFVLSSAGIYVVDGSRLLDGGDITFTLLDSKTGLDKGLTPNSWNYMDADDNLYMSTDSGVVMLNLNHYDTSTKSYKMYVKNIIIDGVDTHVDREEPVTLARGVTRIEIVPEIVNYSSNDPYVSIWLEGFDDEEKVVRQSEMPDIVYTNLRTNTYVFHLAVMDSSGQNILAETSYVINKEKEIYDYWWFRVYVIVVLALTMFYLAWLLIRTQIQRTMFMQKKELELARNQVAMGNETVITIARTVDARDGNTSQHSSRVSEYSVMIAKRLGFDEQQCELLRKTALLHDIGKIGIPDSVLNKPGRLTDEEYEIMKTHVVKGAEILKNFSLVENVEEGVLYHHERYDGKGYVHGLKGEEIPLSARIIGIADAFDAMTANRVYRKKLDFDVVLSELKKGRGTQFDPKLTDIMLSLIEDGEIDIDRLYEDTKTK